MIAEVEAAQGRLATGREKPIQVSAHILFCGYPIDRCLGPPVAMESARRSVSGDRVERVLEITDPFRSRLFNALIAGPASASELAARLKVPASKIRYELDRLLDDELVRVIRRKPSRCTVERVFVCEARSHLISSEDLDSHAGEGTRAMDSWVVRSVFAEALETIRDGAPRKVEDLVIARVVMTIDAEGFAAISARVEALLDELFVLRDRCLEELGERESYAHLALSGLFLFERVPARREER